VIAATESRVRVQGYAFVFDIYCREMYVMQDEPRTRVFNLGDSGLIVNVLPSETAVERVRYEQTADGRLVVCHRDAWLLSVQEFGARR
jgi:hypothetical protein